MELCRRYILNFGYAFQAARGDETELDRHMFLSELAAIIREIDSAATNPYFSRLVWRYPLVSYVIILIRREYARVEGRSSLKPLDGEAIQAVTDLLLRLKSDLTRYYNTHVDEAIDKAVDAFRASGLLHDTRKHGPLRG